MKLEDTIPRLTETDLRRAIIEVLGDTAFHAIEANSGLVAAHEQACMRAFAQNLSGPGIECLRTALVGLNKRGRYPFYDD